MLFCTFLGVQPKHQNGNIFVDIEGFRPCLSKPSYRAPNWARVVRLMQKERLKSPQKSLIFENQAICVILAILAKTSILVIFASHFRTRVDAPKKSPTWVLLGSARRSQIRVIVHVNPHRGENPPRDLGCVGVKPRKSIFFAWLPVGLI